MGPGSDDDMQKLLASLESFDSSAFFAAIRLQKERPWVRDIIEVLFSRPDGVRMDQLCTALLEIRGNFFATPKKLRQAVQSRLNHYTSQSDVFKSENKRVEDDLFFSPQGKRSGTWAVHRERAIAWLSRKGLNPT